MLIERKPQISILTLGKIKFRAENIKKEEYFIMIKRN